MHTEQTKSGLTDGADDQLARQTSPLTPPAAARSGPLRKSNFLPVVAFLLAASVVSTQSFRPAATLPLGAVEKYTFANPQTPLKEIQAKCNLTDEQVTKVAAIQTATKQANAQFQAAHANELKSLHDRLAAANSKNDSAAGVRITQQIRDAEKALTDAWEKARFDILAVLTPEQVQAWRKANILASVKFVYAKITFTPDQLDKIGGLYDDLAMQPSATFEDINASMMQKVPSLLTPQQRQKMGVK